MSSKRSPDSVTQHLLSSGESILVSQKGNKILKLNQAASFVFKNINVKNLPNRYAQHYRLPLQKAREEVKDFKKTLVKRIENLKPKIDWVEELEEIGMEEKMPVVAEIEVTRRCNLSCKHCYLGGLRNRSFDPLQTEEIEKIVKTLKEVGVVLVTFTGGEPFLRDDFLEILKAANTTGAIIEILTNGTLVCEKDIKTLKELRLNRVQISIYSGEADIHDGIVRKRGAFQKGLRTALAMRSNGVPVTLACTVMKDNLQHTESLMRLGKKYDLEVSFGYPIFPSRCETTDHARLNLFDSTFRSFLKTHLKDLPPPKLRRILSDPPCSAGISRCFITAEGKVTPCVNFPLECGDLRKKNFREIWSNSPSLVRFRRLKIKDFKKCSACSYRQFCNMCPGANFSTHGDIFKPWPVTCKLARIRARILDID